MLESSCIRLKISSIRLSSSNSTNPKTSELIDVRPWFKFVSYKYFHTWKIYLTREQLHYSQNTIIARIFSSLCYSYVNRYCHRDGKKEKNIFVVLKLTRHRKDAQSWKNS